MFSVICEGPKLTRFLRDMTEIFATKNDPDNDDEKSGRMPNFTPGDIYCRTERDPSNQKNDSGFSEEAEFVLPQHAAVCPNTHYKTSFGASYLTHGD